MQVCKAEMHQSASPIEWSTSSRCKHAILKCSTAAAIKESFKSCVYFEDRCVFPLLHLCTITRASAGKTSANQKARKLLMIFQQLHCHSNHSSISNIPCTKHSWQSPASYRRPMRRRPETEMNPWACCKPKICQLFSWLKSSHDPCIPKLHVKQQNSDISVLEHNKYRN